MTPERYAAVLAAINDIRAQLGREPIKRMRKGYRGLAELCPIARSCAIDGRKLDYDILVSRSLWHDRRSGQYHDMPAVLHEFVADFDAGKLPEFERK